MNANKRLGNKWTVNEVISLQREYELLEWTVQQIAEKHQRNDTSILYKLESEGFINSWNEARGFNSENYQNSLSNVVKNDVKNVVEDDDDDDDEDEEFGGGDDNDEEYQFVEEVESDDDEESEYDETEVEQLSERVWSLETSVSEISSMVKSIYSILSAKQSNNSSKRKPLRSANANAV